MAELQGESYAPPKVFVSHSSQDADLAEALVVLLRTALGLRSRDIRCTSVEGCRLPGGADIAESIKSDIREALTFVGVISQASACSTYVLWELGARWVLGSHFVPAITADVNPSSLPGPLAGLNVLRMDRPGEVCQLLKELAKQLKTELEPAAQYQRGLDELVGLAARAPERDQSSEAHLSDVESGVQLQKSAAVELPKEEVSILQLLANAGRYMEADEIGASVGVKPERAKYHLQRLVDAEYVHDSLCIGEPPEYGLIHKGRAYLVEHGML